MNGIRVGKVSAAVLLALLMALVSGCAWRGPCPVEEESEPPSVAKGETVVQQADMGPLQDRIAELEKQLAANRDAAAEARKTAEKALKCCLKEYVTIHTEIVYFAFNSVVLDQESSDKLDRIADKLKLSPDYIVEIAGHCDSVGNIEYNIVLGQRRAESVRNYLVDRHRIDFPRVTIRSGGKTEPAAANEEESGRAKNRRATVSVLGYTQE